MVSRTVSIVNIISTKNKLEDAMNKKIFSESDKNPDLRSPKITECHRNLRDLKIHSENQKGSQ